MEYSLFEEFANEGTGEKRIDLFAEDGDDGTDGDESEGSAEEWNDDNGDGEDDEDDEDDWRDGCEDGSAYDIDPWDYDSREEYEDALENAKMDSILNEDDNNEKAVDEASNDDDDGEITYDFEAITETTYIYCQVGVPGILKTYSYLTDDETLKCGDRVMVPFGVNNEERVGTIMSVSRYTAENAPYPVEKTKWVLRRLTEKEKAEEKQKAPRMTPAAIPGGSRMNVRRKAESASRRRDSMVRRLILWMEANGRSPREIVDCLKTVL